MSEPDGVDAPFLDALARRPLVVARTAGDHSVLAEHEGRPVLVACTERSLLASWWRAHAGDAEPPAVREMTLREVLGLWAAPDVDLLVDPGAGGGVLVRVGPARAHLGLGPVVAAGDGLEPLPFVGFTAGRRSLQVLLVLLVVALVLLVVGLTRPDVWFALAGVASAGAAVAVGRPALRELTAARAATRRLREAQRRRQP
jgi:hypothetical protein